MANQNNEFKNTVETLFSGMESFLTSKTVVGEPVTVGNTIILPLVNVSFGVAAGAFEKEKSNINNINKGISNYNEIKSPLYDYENNQ